MILTVMFFSGSEFLFSFIINLNVKPSLTYPCSNSGDMNTYIHNVLTSIFTKSCSSHSAHLPRSLSEPVTISFSHSVSPCCCFRNSNTISLCMRAQCQSFASVSRTRYIHNNWWYEVWNQICVVLMTTFNICGSAQYLHRMNYRSKVWNIEDFFMFLK